MMQAQTHRHQHRAITKTCPNELPPPYDGRFSFQTDLGKHPKCQEEEEEEEAPHLHRVHKEDLLQHLTSRRSKPRVCVAVRRELHAKYLFF